MNFKDIQHFTCSGGKAKAVNIFDYDSTVEYTAYERFAKWADENIFACSPELNGVYGVEQVELVWQIFNEIQDRWIDKQQDVDYKFIGSRTRQFLQLKPQPMPEQSPEKKYRVGRSSGTVILTVNGQTEIGRIHDPAMALRVCEFLNKTF